MPRGAGVGVLWKGPLGVRRTVLSMTPRDGLTNRLVRLTIPQLMSCTALGMLLKVQA